WLEVGEASYAAARLRDAGNEVAAHGIRYAHEYDWYGARLAQQRGGSRSGIADKDIGAQRDQFLGEHLRLIRARWREAIVDADAAAFFPTKRLKCLSGRVPAGPCGQDWCRVTELQSNPSHRIG